MDTVVAYISGSYRAPNPSQVRANVEYARAVAVQLWQRGYVVICPHLLLDRMIGSISERQIMNGCLGLIERSDAMFVLPGWEESQGSRAEIEHGLRMDPTMAIHDAEIDSKGILQTDVVPHGMWWGRLVVDRGEEEWSESKT